MRRHETRRCVICGSQYLLQGYCNKHYRASLREKNGTGISKRIKHGIEYVFKVKTTSYQRRKVLTDHIEINPECNLLGYHAHHIDRTHVIYIPSFLHRSVPHDNVHNNSESMEQINTKTYCWILGYPYEDIENATDKSAEQLQIENKDSGSVTKKLDAEPIDLEARNRLIRIETEPDEMWAYFDERSRWVK
jgi:hypothetical protein